MVALGREGLQTNDIYKYRLKGFLKLFLFEPLTIYLLE